jgi:hypothetical protein
MGQRSIRAARVGNLLEVILKSGNFANRPLARRNQLWLVRDGQDKTVGLDLAGSMNSGELARELVS